LSPRRLCLVVKKQNEEKQVATIQLDHLVQHVENLPALPDTTVKVIRLADDPNASVREIGQIIAMDMAFTSRVLTIANSAFYGMPRSISTVNEAILVLGMGALRNLAVAAATFETLNKEMAGYCLPAGVLWKHSVECAVAAQIIAKQTGLVKMDEAFVAGLLHDVGKVVLNIYVGPQFEAIRALSELDDMPFHVAERMVLGFDHAEVGAKIAEKWNLPPMHCAAIAGHHRFELGAKAPELTAVVHVANVICKGQTLTSELDMPVQMPEAQALDILGLNDESLTRIYDQMILHMERTQPLFG
jgi:putative nucleotidyltransferase with HDIG domain